MERPLWRSTELGCVTTADEQHDNEVHMSDNNLRADFEREIEKAEGEAIFFPEYRRRRLILWGIRTTILAILYIIFWRYEWVRWTLVVSVPLSILFLVSLLVGPRLLRRKIEHARAAIDRMPEEVESDPHSATTRFTDRVDAYTRYRPGYPDLLIDEIRSVISMSDGSVVADIGSGTGLSSELFLRHGMTVYGVEPNEAMRRAGEEYLKKYDRFHSVDGTAATRSTLPSARVVASAVPSTLWKRSYFLRYSSPALRIASFGSTP